MSSSNKSTRRLFATSATEKQKEDRKEKKRPRRQSSRIKQKSLTDSSSAAQTKGKERKDNNDNNPTKSTSKSTKKKTTKTKEKDFLAPQMKDEETKLPWYHVFTGDDEVYIQYMRNEWGQSEIRSDVSLFEKLSLEGAQAGLSWKTILHKREAYRKTFHNFDIATVASMDLTADIERIVSQPTDPKNRSDVVVRHRGKLESIIINARLILELKDETKQKSFSHYLWSFVDDKPILNRWELLSDMPSYSKESTEMSKALRKRGFKFVGPTTCYSMMQSCGFVIDHLADSSEWMAAKERLDRRPGGYQDRT